MQLLFIFSTGDTTTPLFEEAGFYTCIQLAKANPEIGFLCLYPKIKPIEINVPPNLKLLDYKVSRWTFLQHRHIQKAIKGLTFNQCICVDDAPGISGNTPVIRWITTDLKNKQQRWLEYLHNKWLLSSIPSADWQKKLESKQIPYFIIHLLQENSPINKQETDTIAFKQKYTAGNDFVMINFSGITEVEQWILLLKAYTQFKQWNKTGLKLLIGAAPAQEKKIEQLLETYKLRTEVTVFSIQSDKAWTDAISASYLVVDMTQEHRMTAIMLMALQQGIPLIVSDSDFLKQQMKETVLYAKFDLATITSRMTWVYKDEEGCAERRKIYELISAEKGTMMSTILS